MKKILFILLINYLLYADSLPSSIKTTISSVSTNNRVTVEASIPKGTSGIVIHDYGNKLYAITHILVSEGAKEARVEPYVGVEHNKLPNIQSSVVKGDKVIFGNFYNNILIIAPDEELYTKTKQTLSKNFVHPDVYAVDLIMHNEKKITLKNLKAFAQRNQVGLILIAMRENMMVLDPISSEYLYKYPISTSHKSISPFYARFEQISNGFFGTESNQKFLDYYEGVEQIK